MQTFKQLLLSTHQKKNRIQTAKGIQSHSAFCDTCILFKTQFYIQMSDVCHRTSLCCFIFQRYCSADVKIFIVSFTIASENLTNKLTKQRWQNKGDLFFIKAWLVDSHTDILSNIPFPADLLVNYVVNYVVHRKSKQSDT